MITNNIDKKRKREIAEIFTENFYEVVFFKGVPYLCHLILKLFDNIGILAFLKNQVKSSEEIIKEFNFTNKSKIALEWMLNFLNQNNFLKVDISKEGNGYSFDKPVLIEPQKYFQEIVKMDKNIVPSCKLMEYVVEEYPDFLKGVKTGFEIIFSKERGNLWSEYFSNDNSGYSVYNSFGAFGVVRFFPAGNDIKLLEIGGGTGSATGVLLDNLRTKGMLKRTREYIFSDISPIFLRLGNKVIMHKTTEGFRYSLKKIDFNKSLIEQGIAENDVDIVYGVNAIHVAKDIIKTLREILKILKPGGKLIISESMRANSKDNLVQEIIFNLLDDYTNVETASNLRANIGFLSCEQWHKIFENVGFKKIEAMLNTDGLHSKCSLKEYPVLAGVIKGEKD